MYLLFFFDLLLCLDLLCLARKLLFFLNFLRLCILRLCIISSYITCYFPAWNIVLYHEFADILFSRHTVIRNMEQITFYQMLAAVFVVSIALVVYFRKSRKRRCERRIYADGEMPATDSGVTHTMPCPAGYSGNQYIHCSEGAWQPPDQRQCSPMKSCPADGTFQETLHGQMAVGKCPTGYTGTQKAVCSNGIFSAVDTEGCSPVRCPSKLGFPEATYGDIVAAPCPNGKGVQTGRCSKDGFFEVVDRSACTPVCPLSDGFPPTLLSTEAHAPCPGGSGLRHRFCAADGTWGPVDDRECVLPSGGATPVVAGTPVNAPGSLWGRVFSVEILNRPAVLTLVKTSQGKLIFLTGGPSDSGVQPKATVVRYTSTRDKENQEVVSIRNEDGTVTFITMDAATQQLHIRTPAALLGNVRYSAVSPLDPYGVVWVTVQKGMTTFCVIMKEPAHSGGEAKVSFFFATCTEDNSSLTAVKLTKSFTYKVEQEDLVPYHAVLRDPSTGKKTDILRSAVGTLEILSPTPQGVLSRVSFLPFN